MDKELKDKWVAALRSGEFKQAENKLRTESGFCCLGVLCSVIDPSLWVQSRHGEWIYRGGTRWLPSEVEKSVGLKSGETEKPMKMNDDGKSFAEIADYIEKNIPATLP